VSGMPFKQPIKAFRSNQFTSEQYFVGMKVTQAAWESKYF
jgi:hypothetical protein